MNVSPTLVRMAGRVWMGCTISPAYVEALTPALFANV